MSTKTADRPALTSVTLGDGARRDEATLIGPSMWGWVYRSLTSGTWYRLIPYEETADWRHHLHERLPVLRGVWTPQRDWQQPIDSVAWLVIAYRAESPRRSLSESLRANPPAIRLRDAVASLGALTDWWQGLAPPLFPMPADIALDENHQAHLLWIPRAPLPSARSVFAASERALYLAPEFLRSATNVTWDTATWQAVDRYAMGVSLLESYCQLPTVPNADAALFRGATGTLLNSLPPRTDLPNWLDRFVNHRNTVALLRRLTSSVLPTRLGVDLKQLTERLERLLELFDPRHAVAWLRDSAQPQVGLDLLQELFPLVETLAIDNECQYDLLCLAGELCAQYLRRPLEAIDYYERALHLRPDLPNAYRQQLRVIASTRHHPDLERLLRLNADVAEEIRRKLHRNYDWLSNGRTFHAVEDDDQLDDRLVAAFLLWQKQFEPARDFILPRLVDAQGIYIWWDFELNLAYVQAYLGLENGDGSNLTLAKQQLQMIKDGLNFVSQNETLDATLIHQYGSEIADLEYRMF